MLVTTASEASEDAPLVWFATDGVVALGPTSFEQLGSALAGGRLSAGALVRHERWLAWLPLQELEPLSAADRSALIERLARASDRAPQPELAPPSTSGDEPPTSRGSGTMPRSSIRPAAVDPVGVLATADELKDGLLLLLSTAVAASSAQRGAVFQVDQQSRSATVVGAFGPEVEELLGLELDVDDAGFRAALRGTVVIGDVDAGPSGRAIAKRFHLEHAPAHGVALVPLCVDGQLVAVLELAQIWRPFRAREVARAEDVLDVFAERCVVMGWFD